MIFNSSTKMLLQHLKDGDLRAAWELVGCSGEEFAEAVTALTGEEVCLCHDCDLPTWCEDTTTTEGHNEVCGDCIDSYTRCDGCEEYCSETTHVDGSDYCDSSCLGANCTWCERCDNYFRDDDDHSHGGCDCEAPITSFRFPANGAGTVAQDERLAVTLAAGVIDQVGVDEIVELVAHATIDGLVTALHRWELREMVDAVGTEWQTRQGNFTKRLSKALAAKNVKLSPEVVSAIGNLARAHSSATSEWGIEFTRQLNGSAEEFYHEDSCWWGSYSESRCALKNWGGIGMRSYGSANHDRWSPDGRAWVQPLNEELQPTHRTEGAFAYLVYNGYGTLDGFVPARIVAHLAGMSYRKVGLDLSPQYVNNSAGYLVADQATCDSTESVQVGGYLDSHTQTDAHTIRNINREGAAA